MTEKKYEYCRGKYRHYIQDIEKDGVWREGYCGTYGEFDLDKITVLLNRLNDENQRLKIKNRGLQSELEIRKADVDYANKISNELFDEYKQYKKENEQLKSVVKEVIDLLSEEVDVFSDKATEHDINAYIELKEMDNKDAYYMATATKKAIRMLKRVADD